MSNNPTTWQFSVNSLLAFTAYIAVSIALVPVAFKTDFAAVCFAILLLAILASLCDRIWNAATRSLRPIVSVLLGIAIAALVFQWLRYNPRFHWFRLALVLAGVITALPRARIRIASRNFSLSLISTCLLVACFLAQLISTRPDRYFVNRFLNSSTEGLVSRNGMLVVRGGDVSYRVSAPFRRPSRRPSYNPRTTLLDLFDPDALRRPITKFRLLSTSDSIESLSFVDATKETDWKHLARQVQLRYLDFNRLRISRSQAVYLESLRGLHQLAYFGCDLPAGIAGRSSNSKELCVLQLQGCIVQGLDGLSDNSEIRELNLRGTPITIEDLVEIAGLPKLVKLDLRDITLTPEMYTRFAESLSKTSSLRRGTFSCKLTVGGESSNAIQPILKCGAINSVEIHGAALTDSELAVLRSISPNIEIIRVLEKNGGTKP